MPDFPSGQTIRQRLDFQDLSKSPAQQLPTPCRVGKLHSAGGSNNFWRLAAGGVVLPKMDPPDRAGVKASKAVLGIVMSVSTRSTGTVFAENAADTVIEPEHAMMRMHRALSAGRINSGTPSCL